jgi:hypothetical protein
MLPRSRLPSNNGLGDSDIYTIHSFSIVIAGVSVIAVCIDQLSDTEKDVDPEYSIQRLYPEAVNPPYLA